jgi:tRNA threonylcarbamoyladenosine biosynthesis protein TsaE
MSIEIPAIEALVDAVPALLAGIGTRRKIALYGEMGAGKTTLVRAICQHLEVHENTASPTFSLINQYSYQTAEGSIAFVHHLDLYRLNTTQEALDIGVEGLLYDPWYCFIEWPQIIEPILPPDVVLLRLEVVGEEQRRIRWDG